VDKRIANAAAFKLRCQSASIPEAMRASKFSLAESSNPAKQMAVRRAYEKAIGGKTKAAPATVSLFSTTSGSSLSPMTESPRTASTTSEAVGTQTPEREIQAKPKARQIRHTATGMQKWRVNKFDLAEHGKRAFKRATSWYDKEVQTKGKDGLSSYEVAKRVKVEFSGAGPSARTIQRYVNSGLAGLSPLKPGVKSDIPKWAYSALCTAFESYVRINQLNRREDERTPMVRSSMQLGGAMFVLMIFLRQKQFVAGMTK